MAENNSSAPLKTAEGAAMLWCVHVTGADDVHPMPSREVALEEANALNTSICRMKRQDIDPVLIAVVAEWPHSADSHAAGLMIRDECLRMRATPELPATEPAHAAVGLTDALRDLIEAIEYTPLGIRQIKALERARAAIKTEGKLPATEDSSAGELATESVLIEGVAYTIPEPVALELLRLNIELQLAEVQAEPVAWMDDGSLRSGSTATAHRVVTAETKAGMPRAASESFNTPLYTAPQAQPADALDAETPYQRGYRHGYNQRDAEVQGALL